MCQRVASMSAAKPLTNSDCSLQELQGAISASRHPKGLTDYPVMANAGGQQAGSAYLGHVHVVEDSIYWLECQSVTSMYWAYQASAAFQPPK